MIPLTFIGAVARRRGEPEPPPPPLPPGPLLQDSLDELADPAGFLLEDGSGFLEVET